MAKTTTLLPRSTAARAQNTLFPRPSRDAPMSAAALTLALVLGAAPGLSDPAGPTGAGTGCWSPGAAPDLFSWSDTPGIACRDTAETTGTTDTPPASATVQRPAQSNDARSGTAQINFSGSAYAGIAATF